MVPGNFTVNPLDGNEVLMSSNAGRIFELGNDGTTWQVIGDPNFLDGAYAPALTYGAPDPSSPDGVGALDNFIYAGTVATPAAGVTTQARSSSPRPAAAAAPSVPAVAVAVAVAVSSRTGASGPTSLPVSTARV